MKNTTSQLCVWCEAYLCGSIDLNAAHNLRSYNYLLKIILTSGWRFGIRNSRWCFFTRWSAFMQIKGVSEPCNKWKRWGKKCRNKWNDSKLSTLFDLHCILRLFSSPRGYHAFIDPWWTKRAAYFFLCCLLVGITPISPAFFLLLHLGAWV